MTHDPSGERGYSWLIYRWNVRVRDLVSKSSTCLWKVIDPPACCSHHLHPDTVCLIHSINPPPGDDVMTQAGRQAQRQKPQGASGRTVGGT